MARLAYALTTEGLERFLNHVRDAGKPDKVTGDYLRKAGFTSSNDRALPGLFISLGFLDSSRVPTDRWVAYKNSSKAPGVMADAVKEAYAGLFRLYPDAQRKDDEAIRNWLRGDDPSASASTVQRSLATFRALCKHADFSSGPVARSEAGAKETPTEPARVPDGVAAPSVRQVTRGGLAINIELHLPTTDNPEVWDKLFAALRKHILDE